MQGDNGDPPSQVPQEGGVQEVNAFADGKKPIFISLTGNDETIENAEESPRKEGEKEERPRRQRRQYHSGEIPETLSEDFVPIPKGQAFKEGYLWKKGAIVRTSWKKRWFMLDKDRIYYYQEPGGKFLSFIPLDPYTEVSDSMEIPPTGSTDGAFQISNSKKGSDRIFHLFAERSAGKGSGDEKRSWMDAITVAVMALKEEEALHVSLNISNRRMKIYAAPQKVDLNKSVMVFWETKHEVSASDWIGVFKAQEDLHRMPVLEADRKYMTTWKWVDKASDSGSIPFTMGNLGAHFFAYFSAKENTFVGKSGIVKVGPEYEMYVSATNERGLDLSSLMMEEVHVKFRQTFGAESYTSAWIGLYKKSEKDNTKYVTFKWIADAKNNVLTFDRPAGAKEGETVGWYSFSSPTRQGSSGSLPTSSAARGRGSPMKGGSASVAIGGNKGGAVGGSGVTAAKGVSPLKRASTVGNLEVKQTVGPPNTEWEFRLFPLRNVYIDIARASFSDKKKPRRKAGVEKEEEVEKQRERPEHNHEEEEGGDESVFVILHRRFAPATEHSAEKK